MATREPLRPPPAPRAGARCPVEPGVDADALPSVRVETDDGGHRRLITTRDVTLGGVIAPITGTLRAHPSRYSIQVGPGAHLDDIGPIEATNHHCDPSAFVDLRGPGAPTLRARRDLAAGDEVTIDYCATEERMTAPFPCACGAERCYGEVKGFRLLSRSRRDALGDRVAPFLPGETGRAGPEPTAEVSPRPRGPRGSRPTAPDTSDTRD